MTLDIGSSLTGGVRRIANRNGVLLTLAFLITGLVWQLTFYGAMVAWIQQADLQVSVEALPSVDAPLGLLAGGALLALLFLQYLTIITIRTFVNGHGDTIPTEYYTRNIGWVLVNSILGGIAFGILVTVGSILLVIPGIIAYVAFIFTFIWIAVGDENFITALQKSWRLTSGHWLRLFVLLLIVVVGVGVVSGILSALSSLVLTAAGRPALGTLASGVLTLPFSILSLGILAEAFTQLRAEQSTADDIPS